MTVYSGGISLDSNGRTDIIDITRQVQETVEKSGIKSGVATVFVPGSTGALSSIEYENGVLEDLKEAVERMAPEGIDYRHDARWGDGNGYSHVRAALIGPSLSVPFEKSGLQLGTWQQLVFLDFDNRARKRKLIVKVVGE